MAHRVQPNPPRFFKCHGITCKNTGRVGEENWEDVEGARLVWFEPPLDLNPDWLVLHDEIATKTKMMRRYRRAPHGERRRVALPLGH